MVFFLLGKLYRSKRKDNQDTYWEPTQEALQDEHSESILDCTDSFFLLYLTTQNWELARSD